EDGKYNFMKVFDCYDFTCKANKKMTDFFGDGANLIEVKSYKTMWKYPYSVANDVKKELNSNFFKNWWSNQLKSGVVKNKTEIYKEAGLNSEKAGYLISGDKFNISGVYSRWLNISYVNKNHKTTTGWIRCEDTNICS
ncbi:hypothetical protein, partial [Acinetobacter seifertii]